MPTSTISPDSRPTGAEADTTTPITASPVAMASPALITARGPNLSASRAERGVRMNPVKNIGRNSNPVISADRPRTCWKYKLMMNGRP
ncbi:MAG: hypothetical protein ABSA03_01160 [Streptosporangiaceae bacterium]